MKNRVLLEKIKVNFRKYFLPVVILMTAAFQLSCDIPLPNYYDPRFHNEPDNCDVSFQVTINAVAIDERTGNMFAGGSFCSVNGVRAYNIIFYDKVKDTFRELDGGGLVNDDIEEESYVKSMVISGKYLYVGGRFSRTADLNNPSTGLNNIARYDIDLRLWSPLLNDGLDGDVNALVFSENHLYVGGSFLQTAIGSPNLNNIARYEEANTCTIACWQPLSGNGLNGTVHALENSQLYPGIIFVGGEFTQTHNGSQTNLNRIARFDGGNWQTLNGDGLNNTVRAIKRSQIQMGKQFPYEHFYIGGSFTATANPGEPNLVPINRIAKYQYPPEYHPWETVPGGGFDGEVRALAIEDSILIAGGSFTRSFNGETLSLGNIAFVQDVSAENWEGLSGNGLNNSVNALAISPGDTIHKVFVGGTFTASGDGMLLTNLKSLISLDMPVFNFSDSAKNGTSGVDWGQLGFSNVKALNNEVQAIAADANGMIYVGGAFLQTADGAITNLNRIARYNPATKTWSPLANNGLNGPVFALAVSGDNLYVGGQFSQTADGTVTNLNNIAVYNLTTNTWSALPGNGLNNWVYDLAVSGNTLFVGGIFTRTFNSSVLNLNRVARFNTSTNVWSTVSGNGLNSSVFTMALMGDNLYFGGAFTATQTFTAFQNLNRIARYHIPSNTWFLVPTNGLNNAVLELAVLDNFLYLRGTFTATVDSPTSLDRLARFDTATNQWSPITNNRDLAFGTAKTLRVGNELYIGGTFTDLGAGTARHFTRIYLQQWNVPSANSDWFDNQNWRLGAFPAFNTSAVIPAGAGNIQITSADVVLDDLILDGGSLTIGAGRTLTVNGILNLNGGIINGDGTLIITNCQPDGIKGGDSTSYIQSTLVRCVNNSGTFNFEVGTANGYSPVTIKDVSGTGNISIKANQGAYSGAASGLSSNRLARWWQIENPGGGVTNADVHFGYLQTDILGTESEYRAFRISGGTATGLPSSVNTFTNYLTTENITAFSDWTLAELAPLAAQVSIGGRISNASGQGLSKASVNLTKPNGETLTVSTNAFGYYRFDELEAGQTYIVSVNHKRYQFISPSRVLTPNENLENIDFIAFE